MKLNVSITKENQKEITSGNFQALRRFLQDLYSRFGPRVFFII